MTERERFLATMRGDTGRPPLWEEGIQEDTWEAWRAQGLSSPADFMQCFPFDRRDVVEPNLAPIPEFRHNNHPRSFERLRESYQASLERLPADWKQRAKQWTCRDYPLGITLGRGLFRSLGVEDWTSLSTVLYALYDAPALVEAVMEQVTCMALALLKWVRREVMLDFALFSEPIASFHAPVVSPTHYRRFFCPFLQKMTAALRASGVEVIVVQTYGHVEPMIPLWLESGINTLWCFHTHRAGVDYIALRGRYGRDLRLIGGIDMAALLKDRAAIDEALMTFVLPLLEDGGYLPMLEDRVRAYVPYQNYRYYRAQLTHLLSEDGGV